MLETFGSMRDRAAFYNENALKIGLFGANCSGARSATTVPERWQATWPECLRLAKMADAAGIDFMLPIGRWKGYGGETDFHGSTFETITWAASLLAATDHITCFGTVHAPLFHPVQAAKMMVTADQVGQGRFGLNVVCGWNDGEFDMFGVTQREHEAGYDYAQEWIDIIRACWAEPGDFDYDQSYFHLKNVRAFPKPFGGSRPLIMNAGSSGAGRAYALRNCDAYFTATNASRKSLEATANYVTDVKRAATEIGREIEVFTVGLVICRPTQQEAQDYYQHAILDHADWGAVDRMLELKHITREKVGDEEYATKQRYWAGHAVGGYPFVGTPEHVAGELANLSRAGIRGVAVSFVNYLDEFPYFQDEVLPRLEAMGIRKPAQTSARSVA
jgi:dimethylsulfone monooxygenase